MLFQTHFTHFLSSIEYYIHKHSTINLSTIPLCVLTVFFFVFLYRCFIPNLYAALCTAALVPLVCLVGVLVIFIHAYQVTQQWKAYDDVYRGRTNSSGVYAFVITQNFTSCEIISLKVSCHFSTRIIWHCNEHVTGKRCFRSKELLIISEKLKAN